jgi:hypothetical protein
MRKETGKYIVLFKIPFINCYIALNKFNNKYVRLGRYFNEVWGTYHFRELI